MKKRLISGICLVIIFIPFIYLGGWAFAFFSCFLAFLSFQELSNLKYPKHFPEYMKFISLCLLGIFIMFPFLSLIKKLALVFLTTFLPTIFKKDYDMQDALYICSYVLFLGFAYLSLILIRESGILNLLYLIVVAVSTDLFAYLIGKSIGKHKSSPNISPNKTWEGCIGGVLGSLLIGTIFHTYFIGTLSILKIILLTLFLSLIAELGDLVFSKIKRENKIKDFSNLIPGHGGILDRLDSLLFITIFYMLII